MDDVPQSLRNAILWLVISAILTAVFGGGMGSLVGGVAKGSLEAVGVEIGKSLVDEGKVLGKKIADALKANRLKAVYASPTNDYRAWCGIDPNHETLCCNDTSRRLVIEYWGGTSPYAGYAGIQFRHACYPS